ncbi:flagellar hook-length control protein FliK [Alsobacter sp. R-9]
MPIDGVRSNTPTAAKAAVVPGQSGNPAEVVEARAAAILDGGLVRFNTAYGPLDLAVEQPISVGDRARILIENTGAKLTLTFLGLTARGAAATAALSQPLAGLDPAAARLASAGAAPDEALAVAQAAARAAIPTQQPASVLMARLAAALGDASGGLPPSVRDAATQVLSQALRTEAPLDAETLRQAIQRSGIFGEASQARTGTVLPDLKQALVALRAALSGWQPSSLQGGLPPGTAAAALASGESVQPGTPAPPSSAAASVPNVPGTSSSAAANPAAAAGTTEMAADGATQPVRVAPGMPGAAANAAAPSDPARPAAPQPALPLQSPDALDLPPAALRQIVARAFGSPDARPTASDAAAADRQAGAVPRADMPPRAPAPERSPPGFAALPPDEMKERLLSATEGALDRIQLSQYASLPREAPATAPGSTPVPQQPAQQPPAAWVLDVPLLNGREASLAQFRVTRDGGGNAGAAEGPVWSIDVALDTGETGPVHARVRLGAGRLGVTLWAERPEIADRLRNDMPALRRTLDEAAFAVEDVAVLHGAPAAPPRGGRQAGYLLDTRS